MASRDIHLISLYYTLSFIQLKPRVANDDDNTVPQKLRCLDVFAGCGGNLT